MASEELNASNANKIQGLWRPFLLIVVITVVLILARVFGFDERLGDLRDWIETLRVWGYVVFAILYVVATVAGIPGTPITVVAGVLFGSVLGIILVSISSLLGAISAFLIARYFARDAIAHWL
ncbi:MAG: TVP38/TMEM64 family protein, partial [Candidatus Poribacteria bacterium]